ncbi:glycoside hydrolase superfamily [Zopfochytrium polystomum]|nr:glycoside hydrolase superfamily [Zopfochytrium polystomum]
MIVTTTRSILAAVAFLAALDPLAVAGAPAGPTTQNSTAVAYRPFKQPGVIGYWPNWGPYCRPQNSIDKIDLNGVSVVSYAFLNILANGTVASSDSWADSTWIPTTLKIAVGGWSLSRYFSDVAASSTATAAFVNNIHVYMDANGFDGWWCSLQLVLVNAQRYIKNGVNYLTKYAPFLSYIGVMGFDMYTTSSANPYSDIHTALDVPPPNDPQRPKNNLPNFATATAIAQMISDGVPLEKLVLGVAFYVVGSRDGGAKRAVPGVCKGRADRRQRDAVRVATW